MLFLQQKHDQHTSLRLDNNILILITFPPCTNNTFLTFVPFCALFLLTYISPWYLHPITLPHPGKLLDELRLLSINRNSHAHKCAPHEGSSPEILAEDVPKSEVALHSQVRQLVTFFATDCISAEVCVNIFQISMKIYKYIFNFFPNSPTLSPLSSL